MKELLICSIIGCLVSISFASEVVMISNIIKEGHLTPQSSNFTNEKWMVGYNSLSPLGMRQQYILGSEIRQRYLTQKKLADPSCLILDFYSWAMGSDGPLLSIQCFLYGLCPAGINEKIKEELLTKATPPIGKIDSNLEKTINLLKDSALPYDFRSMPFVSDPESLDIFGWEYCPTLVESHKKMLQSEEVKAMEFDFKTTLFPKIASALNIEESKVTVELAKKVSEDFIRIYMLNSLTLEDSDQLYLLSKKYLYQYYKHFFDHDAKMMFGKTLFTDLVLNMKNRVASLYNEFGFDIPLNSSIESGDIPLDRVKIYNYIFHDLQLHTYVDLLEMEPPFEEYIPFTSILLFELYQNEEINPKLAFEENFPKFSVKVMLNLKSVKVFGFSSDDVVLTEFISKIQEKFENIKSCTAH